MKLKHYIALILIALVSGCADNQLVQPADDETLPSTGIMWIGPEKVPCQGVAQQHCYMTNELVADKVSQWQLFYDEIEGFDFASGAFYQLAFERVTIAEPAADMSDTRYVLLSQITKTPQKYLSNTMLTKRRNWYLKSATNVADFKPGNGNPPMLRMSNDTFSGFTGCNKMFGSVEYLFEARALNNSLLKLSSVGVTRRACKDPVINQIEQELQHTLPLVNRFVVRWPHLEMYKNDQLVLQFIAEDWD